MGDNPDPFGGTPDNWSLPGGASWPPTDPDELTHLDQGADEQETETR